MSLPADHLIPVVIALCVGLGLLGAAVLYLRPVLVQIAWRLFHRRQYGDFERPCRYCRLGRASLHGERSDIEGDDLVEVRCFVCASCGLPQWTVARHAVLKKAG